MNKISYKEIKNRNNHKIISKITDRENKLHKQLKINSFNIIELNEEEIAPENDSDLNNFSEREIERMKKKAKMIEEYYINKSEDANINENCFNCLMNNFKPNELLYFSKRKDLLTYLKYCFYFLKKILFLDHQIYIENRYDLDKCDTNYLSGWKFFIPKTVCRGCFLQIINMEHLFGNLKNIFSDVDPYKITKSFHRSRSHTNIRSRIGHSIHRINSSRIIEKKENESERKNKIIIPKKDIKKKNKNSRYIKNNANISYDTKTRMLSIKRDILGEVGNLEPKKTNGKKAKKISDKKKDLNNQIDEQSVTEIKIKIKVNEFNGEGNLSEIKSKKNSENNIKHNSEITYISKKENIINKKDENNMSEIVSDTNATSDIYFKKYNNSSPNEVSMNNGNNIKKNNNGLEIKSNNWNKAKKNMNIYSEILNAKSMSNKLVMKFYYNSNNLKLMLYNTLFFIDDFKYKLYNTMNINPSFISYGITQYEPHFNKLYNESFKAKKEYEEIIKKIKNQSIPSIIKNITTLKEKEKDKLLDEEKKVLDNLEIILNEFIQNINETDRKNEEMISKFFNCFKCFFDLIKEFKVDYENPIYQI